MIAHELAHIKNRDTLVMSIAATVGGSLTMLAELAFSTHPSVADRVDRLEALAEPLYPMAA